MCVFSDPTLLSLSLSFSLLFFCLIGGYGDDELGGSCSNRGGKGCASSASPVSSTSPNDTKRGVAGLPRQVYLEEERAEDVKAVRGASASHISSLFRSALPYHSLLAQNDTYYEEFLLD